MIESLAALAAAASSTLVAAMATDAWQAARAGILRVLRRGSDDEPAVLAAQLDGEAALVSAADDAEAARQSLLPAWRLRLEQFLRDDPEAAEGLRELTQRLAAELPRPQQQWVQRNEAHDGSRIFAVQNGNVIIHRSADPGFPRPAAHDRDPGADHRDPPPDHRRPEPETDPSRPGPDRREPPSRRADDGGPMT